MTAGPWLARMRRTERQLRIARLLFRVLRLHEVEPLPIGEYAVAFGYVSLTNDLRDERDQLREGTPRRQQHREHDPPTPVPLTIPTAPTRPLAS